MPLFILMTIYLTVARLCNAVGMTVIGVTRTKPAEEKKSQAVSQYRYVCINHYTTSNNEIRICN
jgi:hypothetical protein